MTHGPKDRRCRAISHVAFEDLGLLAPVLRDYGYDVHTAEAALTDFTALDPLGDDLWVVLGGPIGVYDTPLYPFLRPEMVAIERRLRAGAPILGICLGAQMMAEVLGGTVTANPLGKEIGWSPLSLSAAAAGHPISAIDLVPVLHWHGDIIHVPEGCTVLASTPKTPVQAFSFGTHALGLQFHAEVEAAGLERWLVGHAAELGAAKVDIPHLRTDNHRHAPALAGVATTLFSRWITSLSG